MVTQQETQLFETEVVYPELEVDCSSSVDTVNMTTCSDYENMCRK